MAIIGMSKIAVRVSNNRQRGRREEGTSFVSVLVIPIPPSRYAGAETANSMRLFTLACVRFSVLTSAAIKLFIRQSLFLAYPDFSVSSLFARLPFCASRHKAALSALINKTV